MTSHFVTLKNGVTLHYLCCGPANAPAVVLVHGWPTSARLWRRIMPGLARRFRVFALDLPGHGRSDKPADAVYDLNFLRDCLLGFLDALALGPVRLAVHDLGGMAGLSLAVRHPERIARLAVMNTGPYPDLPLVLTLVLKALARPWLTRFFLSPPAFCLLMRQGVYHRHQMTRALAESYRADWAATPQGRQAFSQTIALPAAQMVEPPEKLCAIRIPTLILWGTKDGFFRFAVARRLHKDIPGSILKAVPRAGHFLQEDAPNQVLAHLDAFF